MSVGNGPQTVTRAIVILCLLIQAASCADSQEGVSVTSRAATVTGLGNCPAFGDSQACVCTDANFKAQCVRLDAGIHFYPNSSAIGVPDNWISSIAAGAGVKVRYCVDSEMRGACSTLGPNGRLGTMTGTPGNDSVSSIRVDSTADNCNSPGARQVSLFVDQSFGGDCSVLTLPAGLPEADFPDTSSPSDSLGPTTGLNGSFGLPNDSVSSLITGANVRVTLFADAHYAVISNAFDENGLPMDAQSLQTVFEPGKRYATLGASGGPNGAESANANDTASAIILMPYTSGNDIVAFNYKETNPSNAQPVWRTNPQGLAHDGKYWYVTDQIDLYRFSLQDDLGSAAPSLMFHLSDLTFLAQHSCNHLGDPDVAVVNGHHWLFVPVEGCKDPIATDTLQTFLAVFDLDSTAQPMHLQCVDELFLQPTNAAFVAINPKNTALLLSPGGNITGSGAEYLFEYTIHYENLPTCDLVSCLAQVSSSGWGPGCLLDYGPAGSGSVQQMQLSTGVFAGMQSKQIPRFQTLGRGLNIGEPQGGVFSDDGKLFYLANGGASEGLVSDSDGLFVPSHRDGHGLRVFDTTTPIWTEIARSLHGYYGYFSYAWDDTIVIIYGFGVHGIQEPEGLDYLNMSGVPGGRFGGALHAILADNMNSTVYLKHYYTTIP